MALEISQIGTAVELDSGNNVCTMTIKYENFITSINISEQTYSDVLQFLMSITERESEYSSSLNKKDHEPSSNDREALLEEQLRQMEAAQIQEINSLASGLSNSKAEEDDTIVGEEFFANMESA